MSAEEAERQSPVPQREIDQDLGLGSRVTQQSRLRFLNRDGSFNVVRRGLSFIESLDPYHAMLMMSWAKFFLILAGMYILTNILFAFGYILCGQDALYGLEEYEFGAGFYRPVTSDVDGARTSASFLSREMKRNPASLQSAG